MAYKETNSKGQTHIVTTRSMGYDSSKDSSASKSSSPAAPASSSGGGSSSTINLTPTEAQNRAALSGMGGSTPVVDPRYAPGTSEYDTYVLGQDREFTDADAEKIRQQTRARMQGQVDAIGNEYQLLAAQETDRGLARLGQTRSINARSGTLTSDFGAANMAGTGAANATQQKLLQNEKVSKINGVLAQADALAQNEINAKRAEAQGNQAQYVTYLKEKSDKVLGLVKDYAAGGGDIDKLRTSEPNIYGMFAAQYGGSDLLLTAALNSYKTGPDKRDYRFEVKGNKVVAYSVNPTTGALEVKSEAIPGLEGVTTGEYDIKTAENGQLYFIPKEIDLSKPLDEQIVKYGQAGQFDSPSGEKETESEKNRRARSSMSGELSGVAGGDGFVNPGDYQKALNLWVGRGFTARDFHDAFSNFRNPDDDYGNVY